MVNRRKFFTFAAFSSLAAVAVPWYRGTPRFRPSAINPHLDANLPLVHDWKDDEGHFMRIIIPRGEYAHHQPRFRVEGIGRQGGDTPLQAKELIHGYRYQGDSA